MKIELYTEIEKFIAEGYSVNESNQRRDCFLLEKGSVSVCLYFDGRQVWLKDKLQHRDDDLPAIITSEGARYWIQNDKIHREGNRPAIIRPNGEQEYWLDGVEYTP